MIVRSVGAQLILRRVERRQPKTSPFCQSSSTQFDGLIAVGSGWSKHDGMVEEVYLLGTEYWCAIRTRPYWISQKVVGV
jgi:hypothetical protein